MSEPATTSWKTAYRSFYYETADPPDDKEPTLPASTGGRRLDFDATTSPDFVVLDSAEDANRTPS